MTDTVERTNGKIETEGDGVYTITVTSGDPMSADMMDRTLQFVLVELGLDTTWAEVEPPPIDPPQQDAVPVTGPPEPQPTV